jgi:hypothetical protein
MTSEKVDYIICGTSIIDQIIAYGLTFILCVCLYIVHIGVKVLFSDNVFRDDFAPEVDMHLVEPTAERDEGWLGSL